MMFEVNDLHAKVEGEDIEILKGFSIKVNPGEVHAIMGPNGSGKSTLGKVVSGHPEYEATSGSVTLDGEELLELDPDERAHKGLFLALQYPVEIPGVNNGSFLRMAYNAQLKAQGKEEVDPLEFEDIVKEKLALVGMKDAFLDRSVNHGFSGGEKKRNEILQLAVLNPKISILDETDSGLDIDALKSVANAVNSLKRSDNGFLLITHYQRLLDYIVPDFVHIMADGKIVKTGEKELAKELEANGYDKILETVNG